MVVASRSAMQKKNRRRQQEEYECRVDALMSMALLGSSPVTRHKIVIFPPNCSLLQVLIVYLVAAYAQMAQRRAPLTRTGLWMQDSHNLRCLGRLQLATRYLETS